MTALDKYCGAKTRSGTLCKRPSGWGTDHVGVGRCKLHGGATPIKSGRYSRLKTERLRSLIEEYEADPNPTDIMPELAAARALFQDFIERYQCFTDALIAWHQSYQQGRQRPISPEKASAFLNLVDDYEELIAEREDDLSDRQKGDLDFARQYVEALQNDNGNKPHQVLDIGDAYRILSEITKIVERHERIKSANAISRPDLARVMGEMARVVGTYIDDQATLQKIKEGWLGIRI